MKQIVILGRPKFTANYERFFGQLPVRVCVSMEPSLPRDCCGLVLPGGGDISPDLFGETDQGSRDIDRKLDLAQLEALDCALMRSLPVFGICKGMQLINVALGGTILQDMPGDQIHPYVNADSYHDTFIRPGTFLEKCYGRSMRVNSAHHQRIQKAGRGLQLIQWCSQDGCPEALAHDTLPVFGVQWHPERLSADQNPLTGTPLLNYFFSLL